MKVDRVEPLSPRIRVSSLTPDQSHLTKMRDAMQVVPAEQLAGGDWSKRE